MRDVLASILYVPQPSVTGQANTAASTIFVRSITAEGNAAVVTFDADVSWWGKSSPPFGVLCGRVLRIVQHDGLKTIDVKARRGAGHSCAHADWLGSHLARAAPLPHVARPTTASRTRLRRVPPCSPVATAVHVCRAVPLPHVLLAMRHHTAGSRRSGLSRP